MTSGPTSSAGTINPSKEANMAEYNDRYNFVYKFYGVTLDATA